jgi:chemotaxis protein CheD
MMEIFLQPGESFVGDANFRIRTLLGSCVSITMWHPVERIGGMSHFLLASRGDRKVLELDGRYGEESMWLMLREMTRANVNTAECEAKIFGGGNMFPHQSRATSVNVGQNNGDAARKLLQAYRIPIVSESLYGVGHRQVIFDVSSGNVWSRQVRPVDNSALETRMTA